MYNHILIATDGSELASRALTHGLALAKEVKATVTLVTVTQPWSAFDMAHKAREGNRDPMRQFDEIAAAWNLNLVTLRAAEPSPGPRPCDHATSPVASLMQIGKPLL